MFGRKLWKRVLPVILSAAMILETVPVTAFAAEYEEDGSLPEENGTDAGDNAENEQKDEQNGEETSVNSSENETRIAQTDPSGEDLDHSTENAAAPLNTKIVIREDFLNAYADRGNLKYDVDKKAVIAKYDNTQTDVFGDFKSKLERIWYAEFQTISVKVDGAEQDVPEEAFHFRWQKKSGDAYVELTGETPSAPNEYQLVISLDAVDGVCQKAETALDFIITKRPLTVVLSEDMVQPGTTVGAFKTDFAYLLKREQTDWDDSEAEDISDDKAAYIDSVSVTVYDAYQKDTALADSAKFLEGTDYVVSLKPVLKKEAAANYTIAEETVCNLELSARSETWIEAALKNPGEQITKVYQDAAEKQICYESDIKDKLTVLVKTNDATEDKEITLDKAVVTEVWFDSAKQELGEGAAFEPQAAGTYYLGFRYHPAEEDANIYQPCESEKSDLIKVVVERAPLTLVPALKENTPAFSDDMKEADILKYADYKLLNAANEETTIDRNTFWGVSYDDVSVNNGSETTNTRQSYEPVFQLIRAEKDAGGKPVKDENGKELWTVNGGTAKLDASKYCYRLVFTGKKAVYTRTGALSGKLLDVNGSDADAEDKNHAIVTTEEALASNYVDLTITEAKKTKIDVSGILRQNFNTTNLNDLYQPAKLVSKVYDGAALYGESRGEYKKAVVTSVNDNQEVAKDYDSAITYTWYQINSVKAVYDKTDPENPKQTGWEVDRKSKVGGTSNNIPTAAGEYMLEITFAKTGYASCSESVYYRIDKQLLVVDLEKIPAAFKNQSAESYTNAVHYDGTYHVYIVPDNQYSEAVKTEGNLLKDWYQISFYDELNDYPSGKYYKLNWYVEQIQLDGNNAPVKDENGNAQYTKLNSDDALTVTGADTYRLGVTLTSNDSNYTNFEIVYDTEMKPNPTYAVKNYNDFAAITVNETEAGTTAIELEIDTNKLTTTKEYDGKPFYASEAEAWEAVKKALTIRNADTGEVIAQADWPQLTYDITDWEANSIVQLSEMNYGGAYTVTLYAIANATYQFAYTDIEYRIRKLPLTVKPVLAEDIPAGTDTGNDNDGVIYHLSKTEFTGYIETDAAAFQYGAVVYDGPNNTRTLGFGAYAYEEDGQPYYNTLSAVVSKEGDADEYEGYIKYGNEYAVQLTGELAYPYIRNYDVSYERIVFSATRRGNASTSSYGFPKSTVPYVFEYTTLAQKNDQTGVTITPLEPIPYATSRKLPHTDAFGNVIRGEGNYFEFEIQAPKEFLEDTGNCDKYCDSFLYRSSIEAAGGYVLKKFGETAAFSGTDECIVVFPVKEKAAKTFDVIWENGYTEKYTVDFTNAVLEEDLTKAVSPKSLSFNKVNKKMAVGDEQQLDVKIKKAQIGDIIHIDYRVTQGQDVVSVVTDDEKGIAGYVTALKPGKATIAAVPVRFVNGVKTDIEGAKAATAKITVSDVTAPAIKKVTAIDKRVAFTYTKPVNGYRREVYILEGKKKAQDFETLIDSMNGGKWQGIFAAAPVYYVNETVSDKKSQLVEKSISGLSANGEYTLYVRNVSGIRTLADGSCVQLSAKGAVKSFKTTKPQVEALSLYAKNDAEELITYKDVALSNKTEQLYVLGQLSSIDLDEAADKTDKSWLNLPLDKAYKKRFAEPKLSYEIKCEPVSVHVKDIRDYRNYTYKEGFYYKKTDIATVDRKGKVTLKGVGKVTITVKDEITGRKSNEIILNIHATADSIKAKDAKLAVGSRVYLSSLLTYYEGKTAIAGLTDYNGKYGVKGTTYKPNLTISADLVNKINSEGNFYLAYTGDGDYCITALKPKAVCEIAVMDGALSASLKIRSTPILPVKSLSVTDIVDNGFQISISYSADLDPKRVRHRVDITDERGNIVDSSVWGISTYDDYDGKKKLYTQRTYTIEPPHHHYEDDKITRLSKYTVSVTTIVGDETSAKSVKKSVKTTDFPASYEALGKDVYGGMAIRAYGVAGTGKYNEALSTNLQERKYLTSGNTYTLAANVEELAKYRMTDTLTWKSSNPKVASVKAKAGTYTAQLNALMPGAAVLEVTSKLTKKVIARYPVFVKAVGDAAAYYGDYEYTSEYPYQYDPYYTSGIEVLTLQNAVCVIPSEIYEEYAGSYGGRDYKWVKFTAPAFGRYVIYCDKSVSQTVSPLNNDTLSKNGNYYTVSMVEGESFYFKVSGAFTMKVSDYVKQGSSFTVEDGSISIDSDSKQFIEFRSTEDNVYTFHSKELPELAGSLKVYDEKMNRYSSSKYRIWTDDEGIRKIKITLKDKEIIYFEVPAGKYTIYAEKRTPERLTDNGTMLALTDTIKEKWFVYTAQEEGMYTFRSKDATAALTAEYYESLKDMDSSAWDVTKDGDDFTGKMTLKAGQKVFFRISADEAATATFSVTPEIPVRLSVDEEKELSVKPDERRWVSFTVSEAGRYQFRAAATESGVDYHVNLRYYKNAIEENEFALIDENEMIVSDEAYFKPDAAVGDTIYVEITTDKEGADAANVKVSLTQVHAVELKMGEPVTITVKNGDVLWYRFTVPGEKKYVVVESAVTENVGADNTVTDTHKLTADLYVNGLEQRNKTNTLNTIGAYDFSREFSYSKEDVLTIRVSADDLGLDENGGEITTTAVIVLKEAIVPIDMEDPQTINLRTRERRWFSFTAPETDTYLFRCDLTEGDFILDYKASMDSDTWHSMNNVRQVLDLEKDETIYLDFSSTGTPAKLTFSVEFPDKLSGTAEKTVTVTNKTPAYFMYTADSDTYMRYAVNFTADIQDATVTLAYDEERANPDGRNAVTDGYVELNIKDRYFFKVSTTSETPVTVTMKAAPIDLMKLPVGVTENLSVAVTTESGVRKHTWCSFTAPEAGRYVIDKTTSDFTTMSYYEKLTGNPNLDLRNHYYEKGETIYIGLYTTSKNAQQTSVEVRKIEPTQMESMSVEDQILSRGILNTKGYLYTVPKTGIYTLTNEGSGVTVKVYMALPDRFGESVSTAKSLLLQEKDTIYIDVMPNGTTATAKFTIAMAAEVQTLAEGDNTISFAETTNQLVAFTAPDSGSYDFNIVYTGDGSVDATGDAYYMGCSQIIGQNPVLYSKLSGEAGSIAFNNRVLAQGETAYLLVPKPSLATGAAITVSKENEAVETVMEGIEADHTFESGDKVYFIFHVPETGKYQVLLGSHVDAEYSGYEVYCTKYGWADFDSSYNWWEEDALGEPVSMNMEKDAKVCFRVEKTTQSETSAKTFAMMITKEEQ